MITALALTVGLVVTIAMWWADALEDQARLREQPDLTGRLPEMYARPTLTRRNSK